VAESIACGTPAIFGNFSATKEFGIPGALLLRGTQAPADYSDKGFVDVGHWWEPSVEHLTALLVEANDMGAARYRDLAQDGVRLIRTKFSWRATCFAIRHVLIAENEGRVAADATSVVGVRAGPAEESREIEAVLAAGPAPPHTQHHIQPPPGFIRWSGVVARSIRRFGILSTFFGEQLEERGLKHAIAASAVDLVKPYLGMRAIWLHRRMKQIPWKIRNRLFQAVAARPSAQEAFGHRHGARFIGYAEGALGLGQAFRANLAAAEVAGIPFAIYPFRMGIETRLIGPYMPERYDETHAYDVNIIEVAVDQLTEVFRALDPHLLKNSYNILVTYWELAAAPEAWREKLAAIDEIWAPNEFIAKAFVHIFSGPVLTMPPAMAGGGENHPERTHYGMDEHRFYFMFSFDFYSSPYRKNPLGVLEAFQKAFPTGEENVGLVIKSTGAAYHYHDVKATIREAMDRDPRIMVIDQNLSREDILGLIHASDAYVSLHRSEGFGLGMAEALSFGRIVIGTDYSGCTDFLNEQTGYPVPYYLRPVLPHEYPCADGQFWAEPNLAAAVEIMRKVVANPNEARLRGAAGRSLVLERYGIAPVGRLMRARLSELLEQPSNGSRSVWLAAGFMDSNLRSSSKTVPARATIEGPHTPAGWKSPTSTVRSAAVERHLEGLRQSPQT